MCCVKSAISVTSLWHHCLLVCKMTCTEGRKTAVKFVQENKHYGAKHFMKEFPSKHWSLNTCHTWALWRWVMIKRYTNRHILYFTLLYLVYSKEFFSNSTKTVIRHQKDDGGCDQCAVMETLNVLSRRQAWYMLNATQNFLLELSPDLVLENRLLE